MQENIILEEKTAAGDEMTNKIREYLQYMLEKAMAPHSSTLAWKIPWMEEPGGL